MATAADRGFFRPLTENPFLRLATVFVFYIFEGVPMGLFYVAIPAYVAANGGGTVATAAIVTAFGLPWSLKLVNGFLMDRYTFLPMGRRRIWIIGSQSTMVLTFLVGALLAPGPGQIGLISALAFVISAATTFQDVSIDSLVVDIMTEEDQAKAGGIMFGAQTFGMAGATAAGGYILHNQGMQAAFLAATAFLALGILFAIALRERPGERRLPWTAGTAHPRNLEIKMDAWLPLLKESWRAILSPASLLIVPFLLIRAVPAGISDVFNPVFATKYVGWSTVQFTNVSSAAQLGAGVIGLALGGYLTAWLGKRRMLGLTFLTTALLTIGVGFLQPEWANPAILTVLIWGLEVTSIFVAIAMIPLSMQVCTPAVAATQFTIYMALANLGRPIGAQIVAAVSKIDERAIFFTIGPVMLVAAAATVFLKRGEVSPDVEKATHFGAGTGPAEN